MKSRICLCVSVITAALSGCAAEHARLGDHQDHRNSVTLEVRQDAAKGFIPTYGSNGKPYFYRFSGGDDKHGNITVTTNEGGDVGIHVYLSGNQFAIDHVEITDDDNGQLTPPQPRSGNNVVIRNKHLEGVALDAYFLVVVTDTSQSTPVAINCDPRVVNN